MFTGPAFPEADGSAVKLAVATDAVLRNERRSSFIFPQKVRELLVTMDNGESHPKENGEGAVRILRLPTLPVRHFCAEPVQFPVDMLRFVDNGA